MAGLEDSPSVPFTSPKLVEGELYISETIHEETVPAGVRETPWS
jgi:hypothetical protein